MTLYEQTYQDLLRRYRKNTLTKTDLSRELGIGMSTLNRYMSDGINLPNYIKVGEAKNARVLFPLREVAGFLAQTIKVL